MSIQVGGLASTSYELCVAVQGQSNWRKFQFKLEVLPRVCILIQLKKLVFCRCSLVFCCFYFFPIGFLLFQWNTDSVHAALTHSHEMLMNSNTIPSFGPSQAELFQYNSNKRLENSNEIPNFGDCLWLEFCFFFTKHLHKQNADHFFDFCFPIL